MLKLALARVPLAQATEAAARKAAAIVACLSIAVSSCNGPGAEPAAPRNDPQHSAWLSTDGASFRADDENAMRAHSASLIMAEGKLSSLDGVMNMLVGHELGHQFEAVHGKLPGMSSEDFADFFSIALIYYLFDQSSRTHMMADEFITVSSVFFDHATAHRPGANEPAELRRRKAVLACAHFGAVSFFVQGPDRDHLARRSFLPLSEVPELQERSRIGGVGKTVWLRNLQEEKQAAQRYLASRSDVAPADVVRRCAQRYGAFVEFVTQKIYSRERTERLIRNDAGFRLADIDPKVEYQRPETEGAQVVFASVVPHDRGAGSGVAYLPWLLVRGGWFGGVTEPGLVRLVYCGIGDANAHVVRQGNRFIITFCYEIGEEITAHLGRYPITNGTPYIATIRALRRSSPDIVRRTEQMIRRNKSPANDE